MNSKTSNIYPWVIVGLLWGVALLNYMDRQMLSTMQEAMKIDIVVGCKFWQIDGGLFVGIWVDESHFRDYR